MSASADHIADPCDEHFTRRTRVKYHGRPPAMIKDDEKKPPHAPADHNDPTPASFEQVLAAELDDIAHSRQARGADVRVWKGNGRNSAFSSHLIGLALSGGGIRSATFSLGVIQHLASRGILDHID